MDQPSDAFLVGIWLWLIVQGDGRENRCFSSVLCLLGNRILLIPLLEEGVPVTCLSKPLQNVLLCLSYFNWLSSSPGPVSLGLSVAQREIFARFLPLPYSPSLSGAPSLGQLVEEASEAHFSHPQLSLAGDGVGLQLCGRKSRSVTPSNPGARGVPPYR